VELFQPWHLIILMICSGLPVVLVIPFWQIFKKAGMPAPLSLLMVFPLVNLIMLYVLAFSTWKATPSLYPAQQSSDGGKF
jgi:hypothetical protein